MMNKDFEKYVKSKHRSSSNGILDYTNKIYGSLTPYVLEERELRATQMDIFSRLLMDRIIWILGPVNDAMSATVQAQLMWLDLQDGTDITMHIDTPGGGVKAGLGMVDVMNYITPDIKTINTGMAASMGSILLGAGTKGKRHTLQHSRVMLHQVSGGADGHIEDMKIMVREAEKYNDLLFELLATYCDKTKDEVIKTTSRDLWLNSDDAIEYGIVDSKILRRL